MGHADNVSPNPSFLKALQGQFSQPFLLWPISHSSDLLCGPSLDPLHPVHIFFCVVGTKTECGVPGEAWQVLSVAMTSLSLLGMHLLMQLNIPLGFFLPWQHPGHSHWACCPAGHSELLELLLSWVDPTLCYTLDTFPRFKTSHLLNFMRFLLAHSYKGLPAGLLSQSVLFPPSSVSSVGFLRAH